jgi:ADP-ribose pyrophosphatase YjhB (NUDIX family)
LGGGIEFGEPSRDAMLREIQEEIGAEVEGLELIGVLENIFICEGVQGHEVVFIYDARFKDSELYEREEIQCYEMGCDAGFVAKWRSLQEIRTRNIRLVPQGLADLLSEGN